MRITFSQINEMTYRQKELIEQMNEFCYEKFTGKTKEEASEYISRNMQEFKLLSMDNWQTEYM